jgi:serine/threonine-protein kinase
MKACPACNTRYDDNTTYCVKDGSAVVPDVLPANQSMIGQLIGDRYKVIRKIGEGGMGEVYLAEHIHIEKRVALKLLRAEVLSNQEAVSRFRIEARSASSIGHDNIIQIDDFGTLPDGRVYMAMEFLQGAPLNEMIAREPLPLPTALDILIQTGKGLAAAHAKNITHRDMKPENVYVTQKEGRPVPKILDFGIAKVSGGDTSQNLTVAGTIFGTPFYMAPEQAMGGKMDHRVDIYAMGIIMYEVFTGTVPFKAETFMGILTQHITQAPVPPAQQAAQNGRICPPELEAIILKAIQKEPAQRYQSMGEMVNALIEFYRFAVGVNAITQAPWSGPSWRASASIPAYGGTGARTVPPTPKRSIALPLILGLIVLLGGGGAAAYFLVVRPDGKEPVAGVVPDAGGGGGTTTGVVTTTGAGTPDAGRAGGTTTVATGGAPDAGSGGGVAVLPPRTVPDAGGGATVIPDRPDPPDRVRTVDVTIVSQPPNAIVYKNNTYVCQAPCSVQVKVGDKAKYVLKLEGYKDAALTVDGVKKIETKRLARKDLEYVNPDLKPPEDDDGLAVPRNP